ncbi:hypothetical protein K488DRAFT_75243, partial [Vararia minispora EC-137]
MCVASPEDTKYNGKEAWPQHHMHTTEKRIGTPCLTAAGSGPSLPHIQQRQADVWKEFGYLPADLVAPNGAPTKEVSHVLEYAFGDFAISQVAKILGNTADLE